MLGASLEGADPDGAGVEIQVSAVGREDLGDAGAGVGQGEREGLVAGLGTARGGVQGLDCAAPTRSECSQALPATPGAACLLAADDPACREGGGVLLLDVVVVAPGRDAAHRRGVDVERGSVAFPVDLASRNGQVYGAVGFVGEIADPDCGDFSDAQEAVGGGADPAGIRNASRKWEASQPVENCRLPSFHVRFPAVRIEPAGVRGCSERSARRSEAGSGLRQGGNAYSSWRGAPKERKGDGLVCSSLGRAAATALAFAVGLAVTSPSEAIERVALVIGNSAYANVPALANPLNDASDIGDALDRLGFSVTRIENADQAALRQSLQEFQRAASASDIAVVFYAGHGMEVDQRNFLVPVDARLVSDQDIEFEAVPLELVSRAVARASKLRLVVLDACRDNPFAIRMQRAGATRSIGRGLARVEPPGETLVAYAAKEGTVASDGAGRNSPYSAALLAHLEEPGLEVGMLFRKVRDAVVRETGGRQEPFVYGSLSSEGVYFSARLAPERDSVKPPAGGAPGEASASGPGAVAAIPAAAETAARAYEAAERLHTLEGYEAVAERFPGSIFADLARGQIRKLSGEGVEGATASAPLEVSVAGAPGPDALELALELDRPERRLVQIGLASLGFDPGRVDGLFGRGTRGAIGRLQASRGLEATGYLDAEFAKELLAAADDALAG